MEAEEADGPAKKMSEESGIRYVFNSGPRMGRMPLRIQSRRLPSVIVVECGQ